MRANPSQPREAVLTGAPEGLVGTLTFRLIDPPSGEVILPQTTAGVVEAVGGTYIRPFTTPSIAGTYLIVWDDGADLVTAEQLEVVSSALEVPEPSGTRPTSDQVALLLRTRTTGELQTGLGADTGMGELTTFDETTRPTAAEVEQIITSAYDSIVGQLDGPIPESREGTVAHTVALYAAVLIEVSYFRESVNNDLLALWRDLIERNVASVNRTIDTEDVSGGRVPQFGSITVGTTRVKVVPEADYMVGIDWP